MPDLIDFVRDAVRSGAVPRPVPSEPIDDFRFRVAHAGAMAALSWYTQVQQEAAEAQAEAAAQRAADQADYEVATSAATVTSLPVTAVPAEQDVFPEAGHA